MVSSRPRRRNRISTADARVVGVVAVTSGIVAAFADAHPTEIGAVDVGLAVALAAFTTWIAASSPWWALAAVGVVAVLCAANPVLLAAGLAATACALAVGWRRASWPVVRALSAAASVQVILRCELDAFHGESALLAAACFGLIILTGLPRRSRVVRRRVRRGALLAGGFTLVAVGLLGIGSGVAAGRIVDGERDLRAGISALRVGDDRAAAEAFDRAASSLAAAERWTGLWVRPSLAVPVVAQHARALTELTTSATDLAETASTSLAQVDFDQLQVDSGVVDLAAIEVLVAPLTATREALADLRATLDRIDDPWLVGPISDRVDDLENKAADIGEQTEAALEAVRLAPAMLGADTPRTYFVAFTNPAEARGLGGYMGGWAELRADRGQVQVTRSGRTIDLNLGGDAAERILTRPADYLSRYARFGAGGNGRPVAVDFWSNVTMSPDFPSVAEVISQLYPLSGGTELDGVLALDPFAVADLLQLTGPVELPEFGVTLDAASAADFVLREQYEAFDPTSEEREEVLETLAEKLTNAVFSSALPGPRLLADALSPAIRDGRLVLWSSHDDEAAALRRLGVDGALPEHGADGLAVVSVNAAGNKLDAYLRRSVRYEAKIDEDSGAIQATATVVLRNEAPPQGLTDYVAGNQVGLPNGTNRMYLSVYSPLRLAAADVDGHAWPMESEQERGWWVYSTYVNILPGDELNVKLSLIGEVPDGETYRFVLRPQALAFPDVTSVRVRDSGGDSIIDWSAATSSVTELP